MKVLGNITCVRHHREPAVKTMLVTIKCTHTVTTADVLSGRYIYDIPMFRYYDGEEYIGAVDTSYGIMVSGETWKSPGMGTVTERGQAVIRKEHWQKWKVGDNHTLEVQASGQIPTFKKAVVSGYTLRGEMIIYDDGNS